MCESKVALQQRVLFRKKDPVAVQTGYFLFQLVILKSSSIKSATAKLKKLKILLFQAFQMDILESLTFLGIKNSIPLNMVIF